jgi:dimethylargininase
MIALTHTPSTHMQACERTFVPHAAIDHAQALAQHAAYCQTLRDCRAEVITLSVNQRLPDCAFIEDTAIVLDEVAIVCPMGAQSRREEPAGIEPVLQKYCEIERIDWPATIEGGDVLRLGRTLLVGQSCRTNAAAITVLTGIVGHYGYRVRPVPVRGCLHLKTACTALPDGRLLVNRGWIEDKALADFELVDVPESEPWGGNVLLARSRVLLPAAHSQTAELLDGQGFTIQSIELSEFAKAEGGVTCLSLLIP